MDFRRDDCKRIARAPAKLNLFLNVLGRRDDGFHELETLMVPIQLSDSLSLIPTPAGHSERPGELHLTVRHCSPAGESFAQDQIPSGKDNLVIRSLELLRQRSGCTQGAQVELIKRIPSAAGLGGGSSDAASALRLANHVWQLHWSTDRLADLASELGSDVPFFLGHGAAIVRSRGERIDSRLRLPTLHFVVVKPRDGLRTEDVYRAHRALGISATQTPSAVLERLPQNPSRAALQRFWPNMHNSLQEAAALLSPWIEKLRAVFNRLDCLAHQLSGSGSAYFGVCRNGQHARRLANFLRTRQLGHVYDTRSCC